MFTFTYVVLLFQINIEQQTGEYCADQSGSPGQCILLSFLTHIRKEQVDFCVLAAIFLSWGPRFYKQVQCDNNFLCTNAPRKKLLICTMSTVGAVISFALIKNFLYVTF